MWLCYKKQFRKMNGRSFFQWSRWRHLKHVLFSSKLGIHTPTLTWNSKFHVPFYTCQGVSFKFQTYKCNIEVICNCVFLMTNVWALKVFPSWVISNFYIILEFFWRGNFGQCFNFSISSLYLVIGVFSWFWDYLRTCFWNKIQEKHKNIFNVTEWSNLHVRH